LSCCSQKTATAMVSTPKPTLIKREKGPEEPLMRDELEKLAEQQAAILEAIAAIKDQLDAGEWRRKCLWELTIINRSAEALKKFFPGKEQTFKEILEPLDCYATLAFKSPQDLHTVFTCFTLIAGILEDAEKT